VHYDKYKIVAQRDETIPIPPTLVRGANAKLESATEAVDAKGRVRGAIVDALVMGIVAEEFWGA
jgi:hypothetical protein